jgi:hypothetical protein
MTFDKPYDAGWQINIDNDLSTGSDINRDYTGKVALAFSSRRARDSWLNRIDQLIGIQELQFAGDGFSLHTFELSFVMLTPEYISLTTAQPADHPYANFLFIANSQQVTFSNRCERKIQRLERFFARTILR